GDIRCRGRYCRAKYAFPGRTSVGRAVDTAYHCCIYNAAVLSGWVDVYTPDKVKGILLLGCARYCGGKLLPCKTVVCRFKDSVAKHARRTSTSLSGAIVPYMCFVRTNILCYAGYTGHLVVPGCTYPRLSPVN